ncbi:hypothetical protein JW823_03995 [bacterium]|nr:hypothetical protein [candidate division CSSED10-310 bacterium]
MASESDAGKLAQNNGNQSAFDAERRARQQQYIGSLIEKLQKAREAEDFYSARDFCREWLEIDPKAERAQEILVMIETTLNREREDRVALNHCQDLFLQQRYNEVIDLLDRLESGSPLDLEIRALHDRANQKIRAAVAENAGINSLDEISRLLDHGHLDLARNRLSSLEMPEEGDLQILRRKLDRALEVRSTEKSLTLKLHNALDNADIDSARNWLGMICELNPRTEIFDVLKKSLPPELYENLTSRIALT